MRSVIQIEMETDSGLRQLVKKARTQDHEALASIYEKFFNRIYRYILVRVNNREIAEDLSGLTFLKLVERIGGFRWRGAGFTPWLFRIAHNVVVDHFRRQREIADPELLRSAIGSLNGTKERGPQEAVLADETLQEALMALMEIGEDQRQVIILRLVAGLSGRETAEVLDLTEINVRALQHRGLAAVRKRMRVNING